MKFLLAVGLALLTTYPGCPQKILKTSGCRHPEPEYQYLMARFCVEWEAQLGDKVCPMLWGMNVNCVEELIQLGEGYEALGALDLSHSMRLYEGEYTLEETAFVHELIHASYWVLYGNPRADHSTWDDEARAIESHLRVPAR